MGNVLHEPTQTRTITRTTKAQQNRVIFYGYTSLKERVVMMPNLSSLVVLAVVITTAGATSDDKVGIIITPDSQYIHLYYLSSIIITVGGRTKIGIGSTILVRAVSDRACMRSEENNFISPLHERDDVSNHRQTDCLLNSLFNWTKKTASKPPITGLSYEGGINQWQGVPIRPGQSECRKLSKSWRHHDCYMKRNVFRPSQPGDARS